MIEMALAMTTLLVGILSISAATLRMHALGRQNRDRVLAHNALSAMAERINSAAAAAALDPGTWSQTLLEAYGPDGAIGDTFEVAGLNPAPGEAVVGRIEFFLDETLTDDDIGTKLAMPRDLNGDGDMADVDVAADARMLPVVITVTWNDHGRAATKRHPLYVMGY